MKNEEFDRRLRRNLKQMERTLASKAEEYAHGDRLHNFKVAARASGMSPQEALWGMAMKHFVSVQDLVYGRLENTEEMAREKILDLANYLLLLDAVLAEEREENGPNEV